MKTILPLNIKCYEFRELSSEAQEKVINEHINFWMNTKEYNEEDKGNFEKAIDKADSMHTPWFTGCYIYDYCKDEIIEEIEINNYLFDETGELLPITYHMKNNYEVLKTTYKLSRINEIEITII